MTTWADTKRYLHANYLVDEVAPNVLKLLFTTANERSQIAFVALETSNTGVDWVRVNSQIGLVGEVDLRLAAEALTARIVGGLVVYGDTVHVTNSVPLANLDANELVEPLERVVSIADELEAQLLGRDLA